MRFLDSVFALFETLHSDLKILAERIHDHAKATENASAADKTQDIPQPFAISIPEGIENRKSVADKKDSTDYQNKTLFWQRFTFYALVVYAFVTLLIYCANKKAADAATKTADTDARPYVVVDNVWKAHKPPDDEDKTITRLDPCSADTQKICFDLFYTVTGHTPAIDVRRNIHVLLKESDIDAEKVVSDLPIKWSEPKIGGNPPMSSRQHEWIDSAEHETLSAGQIDQMLHDQIQMYVYGAIEYRDMFDACHVTRFCFVERVKKVCRPEGCFDNCAFGNSIDEDRDVQKCPKKERSHGNEQ
jgi:hypothetical protein